MIKNEGGKENVRGGKKTLTGLRGGGTEKDKPVLASGFRKQGYRDEEREGDWWLQDDNERGAGEEKLKKKEKEPFVKENFACGKKLKEKQKEKKIDVTGKTVEKGGQTSPWEEISEEELGVRTLKLGDRKRVIELGFENGWKTKKKWLGPK